MNAESTFNLSILPVFFTEVLVRIDARVVQRDHADVVVVDRPLGRGGDLDVVFLLGKQVGRGAGLGADPGRRGGDSGRRK